jgi:hypothetical protein
MNDNVIDKTLEVNALVVRKCGVFGVAIVLVGKVWE